MLSEDLHLAVPGIRLVGLTCSDVSFRTRALVRIYLAVLAIVGFTSMELWPLTSFHLFSQVRHREDSRWRVVAAMPDGKEEAVQFHQLPIAFRQTYLQIGDFRKWSSGRRDKFCDAWVDALNDQGSDARWIRIYQARYDVVDGRLTRQKLIYECGRGRVRYSDGIGPP